MSDTTRKLTRTLWVLRFIDLLVLSLTLFVAGVALAQTKGSSSPSNSSSAGSSSRTARGSVLGAGEPLASGGAYAWIDAQSGVQQRQIDAVGDPLFLPAVVYESGATGASNVAAGDLNGDGKLDLVVSNRAGAVNSNRSVGVFLGNGDGSFQAVVLYDSGGIYAHSVAIADVNRDGLPDLLVANGCNHGCSSGGVVGVLLGNGDGTFQPVQTFDSGSTRRFRSKVAVADVNGDHKLDLIVSSCGAPNAGTCGGNILGFVGVLLGNGDGTFQPVVTYGSNGYNTLSLAVADVNGDGHVDIVTVNWCAVACNTSTPTEGSVGVLLGKGNGTFQPVVLYGSGGQGGSSIAIADVNGDGKPDLLTGNCGPSACSPGDRGVVGVLLGNGDGSFQLAHAYDAQDSPTSIAVADVNGDGNPDVVVANWASLDHTNAGNVSILIGFGDATFQLPLTSGSGGDLATSILVADLNGDGAPDIAVANSCLSFAEGCTTGAIGVLLNAAASNTTTALVSTKNPVQPRQRVDYIATVTTKSGAMPTGTVTFRDGNQTLGSSPLFGNQAQLNYIHYTQNNLGAHSITAVYSGDADNDPSISTVFTENVQWSSRMDLTTSGSPSLVGQPVTFTATPISHGGFVPNGEIVTFFDFKTQLGIAATAGGQAIFTTSSLTAKRHTIRATYPGDSIRQPSTASIAQIVNKYSTTSGLTSSPNPSVQGQAVTFTVTVTPSGPFTPNGKVKFLDGTTGLGYATLSGSVATFSKSSLTVGTHSITAQYLGDATSDKSTSSAVSQVVNP